MISTKEKIKRLSAALKVGDLVYVENIDGVSKLPRNSISSYCAGKVFTVIGPAIEGMIPILLPDSYKRFFVIERTHLSTWGIDPKYLGRKFIRIKLTFCQTTRVI